MKPSKAIHRLNNLITFFGLRQSIIFLVEWMLRGVMKVRLAEVKTPLLLRPRSSDILVLWEIFKLGECAVPQDNNLKCIIDAGAYAGYSTVYFATHHPDAKIIAIEPDPENFSLLCANCSAYANVHPVHAGLWKSSACLRIKNAGVEKWAFRLIETDQPAADTIKGVTIPDLMKQFGVGRIDILKLDIEGAEAGLFSSGFEAWLDKVGTIVVETHSQAAKDALLKATNNRGFKAHLQGEKTVLTR